MARTNREILTGGKKYATKQAKKHRVEEVVFDKDARVEYLTGFHKRKVERQKKAQVYNKEQERLARIEERKKMKDERKKDMEKQMERFNATVKDITSITGFIPGEKDDESDAESWDGIDENTKPKVKGDTNEDEEEEAEGKINEINRKGILQHKEIYKLEDMSVLEDSPVIIDDETTVTVESMDNPSVVNAQKNLETLARANNVDLNKSEKVLEASIKRAKNYAVVCGVSKPSKDDKSKQKKKKFRYLSKGERRENTRKERSKNNKYKK
ncbi:ribosomal RNA-processing protein 17 [[Candida] railenensis]|uniref:Ribosomal RNA-processing protein 17 n=1 Tax=[Candida] railenensis TaxID=45579 RepID=A0A9P0VZY4_9ASCO|nr:ribosomal RNA-processing protein 17 [[Candida] railenensis]